VDLGLGVTETLRYSRLAALISFLVVCLLVGCTEGRTDVAPSAWAEQLEERSFSPRQLESIAASDAWDTPSQVEVIRLRNEATAQCMVQRGFEFSEELYQEPPAFDVEIGLSEVERTQRYGLGVAYFAFRTLSGGSATDPVAAFLNDQPAGYRASFEVAYYGAALEDISDGSIDSADLANGCRSIARVEADAASNIDELSRKANLLGDATIEILDRFQADPAVAKLNVQYAECMADRGFTLPTPSHAYGLAHEWFREVQGDVRSSSWATMSSSDRSVVDRAVEREVELALISLECQAPARAELHARYVEIESEWIRENPERVAALSALAD